MHVSGFKARTTPCEVIRSSSIPCHAMNNGLRDNSLLQLSKMHVVRDSHVCFMRHCACVKPPGLFPLRINFESSKHTEISGNMMDLIQYEDKHDPMSLLLEPLTTGSSCDAIFHIYAMNYR